MKFGPSSRIGDILASPGPRALLDSLIPGFSDHPARDMASGLSISRFLDFQRQSGALDEDAVSRFLETLGTHERTVLHRGIGVESRPLADYETQDVKPGSAAVTAPASASRWSTVEITFAGPSHGNPFTDVDLTADFTAQTPNGTWSFTAGGFYDGDGRWIVRVLPETTGTWTFTTSSNARSLDGITGTFDVTDAAEGDHGPVRADGFHLSHADGTRHHPFGTTAYAWIHQPANVRAATLRALAVAPFTKIRMCVFPKSYQHNANEPEIYPFEGNPEEGFDFARPNPTFFRHLEEAVQHLARLGIQADVILFHPYDRWGFAEMGAATDDHYTVYTVRRLAAFANVWWSMANEYDFVAGKSDDDWERLAALVTANDPVGHMHGIHNGLRIYDHTRPWITHASIQSPDPNLATTLVDTWREKWGKPVIVDECGYEGTLEYPWGSLTGEEMTHRFWEGAVRGGYVTHGETFDREDDQVFWAKGGELVGESPARIAFLRRVVEEAPGGALEPMPVTGDIPRARHEDEYFLYYFGRFRPAFRHLALPAGRTYRVELIDTWNMTVEELPSTFSGAVRIPLPAREFIAVRVQAVS